ncbi:MAG: hypothetical protein ACTSV7_15050 [Candidatus Baldrarchaeia archaeon]
MRNNKLTKAQEIALALIDKELLTLEAKIAMLKATRERILRGEPKLKEDF